ncbi:MAG: hypothetical protein HOD92_02660 [Deltaproteobacteria bacterium]|jgi:hypothetical protein|nr:hypothetical protein [Deltaproteobacteria bacterium]MBT4527370.1 hypothetical protein [Deltaproteobacteria bacterium]
MTKIRSSTLFICLILLTFSACTRLHQKKESNIQIPKGWVYSPNNAFIKYVNANEVKPGYELVIARPSQNMLLAYVTIAESILPDQNKYKEVSNSNLLENNQIKNWYFERPWWINEYNDFKIPFALTSDCVNYYIGKYADIKKNMKIDQSNSNWRGSNENRIFLHYITSVKPSETKKGAVIVSLKLKWYYFCGQTCGWGFKKERQVVFASPKKIIEIIGDTPADVWVASEEKPYAPDQWITY